MAQIQATGVSHSLNLTSIMPVPSRQSFRPRHGMPPEGVDGAVLHAVEALQHGHNHLPVQVCTAFREVIPIMYSFIQRLVALGGHDGVTRLKSAEIYDPGWELDFYEVDEIPL